MVVCDDVDMVAIKEQQGQGREGSVIGGTTKQRPRKTTLGVINLVREDRPFDYPWVAPVVNTFDISSHRWFSLLVEKLQCGLLFGFLGLSFRSYMID